jgi:DNA replication protein DnaC
VTKAEPVLLIGEAGTGKTHLATGLCVAACRQRPRVQFTIATALINELAEAAHTNQLSRALGRWERLGLICIDELCYGRGDDIPSPGRNQGHGGFCSMALPKTHS